MRRAGHGRIGAALLLLVACTTTPLAPEAPPRAGPAPDPGPLAHATLPEGAVRLEPEPITVEQSWILEVYTRLHARDYRAFRIGFPGHDGEPALAHWLVPNGPGPHPTVIVFPILAGSHVVSEALAKALVGRGYAVLRMERRPLALEKATDPAVPMDAFRDTIRDARRMLDWLVTRPETDPGRLAAAGVSLGGMMASTLLGVEPRLQAGFFLMAGGGLAELLHDSTERPVRKFRDRLIAERGLEDRDAFLRHLRPWTEPVDPLRYVGGVEARRVLLVSGRFDRVVPPERTRALWEALGRPAWIRIPAGHYQLFPFFWWCVGRGADHLDRVLGTSPEQLGAGEQATGDRVHLPALGAPFEARHGDAHHGTEVSGTRSSLLGNDLAHHGLDRGLVQGGRQILFEDPLLRLLPIRQIVAATGPELLGGIASALHQRAQHADDVGVFERRPALDLGVLQRGTRQAQRVHP